MLAALSSLCPLPISLGMARIRADATANGASSWRTLGRAEVAVPLINGLPKARCNRWAILAGGGCACCGPKSDSRHLQEGPGSRQGVSQRAEGSRRQRRRRARLLQCHYAALPRSARDVRCCHGVPGAGPVAACSCNLTQVLLGHPRLCGPGAILCLDARSWMHVPCKQAGEEEAAAEQAQLDM